MGLGLVIVIGLLLLLVLFVILWWLKKGKNLLPFGLGAMGSKAGGVKTTTY